MRHDADMLGNAADLSDVADMQRDVQHDRNMQRLHYLRMGKHLPRYSDLRGCSNLQQPTHLSGWCDLSGSHNLPQPDL